MRIHIPNLPDLFEFDLIIFMHIYFDILQVMFVIFFFN